MDPEKLLVRLNSGKELNADEIAGVANALARDVADSKSSGYGIEDVYTFILILGHARAREHRKLIEHYLKGRDPVTVAKVLEILCIEWGECADYLEHVINFALGASWDYEDDVCQMALKILGEFQRQLVAGTDEETRVVTIGAEATPKILELLLRVFDDENSSQWVRQHAYYALCRIAGKDWEDIPSEYRTLDFSADSEDIDSEVVNYCVQLLETSKSPSGSSSAVVELSPVMK